MVNKKFWKTIKPKFPNNRKTANTIILVEDEKILKDKKAITNYFTSVIHSLGLKTLDNTLSKIVKNFRNFERIKKIKESLQAAGNSSFSFKMISEEEVKNVIKDLPMNKSTISGNIPTKILRQNAQIYSKKLNF